MAKSDQSEKIERPSFFLLFTEAGRALAELGMFFSSSNSLKRSIPRGDGHPVLVLPGFMASDTSTYFLREFLGDIGYEAYGWEMGRNYGDPDFEDKLFARTESIYQKHHQKISLIGWSLGGVYARQIAKAMPEKIRQVITLGSPFGGLKAPNNVAWIHDIVSEKKGLKKVKQDLIDDIPKPAPVPTTAIYTKEDGIVSWKVCKESEECETRQNIQVRGSHVGLGVNPAVVRIIADRLQYKQENWIPFEGISTLKNLLFYPSL